MGTVSMESVVSIIRQAAISALQDRVQKFEISHHISADDRYVTIQFCFLEDKTEVEIRRRIVISSCGNYKLVLEICAECDDWSKYQHRSIRKILSDIFLFEGQSEEVLCAEIEREVMAAVDRVCALLVSDLYLTTPLQNTTDDA